MKFLLPILLCSFGWAQTPAPSTFVLAGPECAATTTPHCGASLVYATAIAGSKTYSWTKLFEAPPSGGKFAAAVTTTGLCKDLYDLTMGRVSMNVLGCAAAGASTTATATTLALDGGGGVYFSGFVKKWPWLHAWIGGLRGTAAGVTETRVMVLLGN